MNRVMTVAAAIGAVFAASGQTPARADVVPFTWDLSKAVPSLGGGPFTADAISMTTYLYALQAPGGDTPESFIFQINAFRNGAADVTPSGLGSAYGLYLFANANVSSANQFTRFDIALRADPGNLNGAPSSTLADGVHFANTGATGAADDIILATGTIVSASTGIQSNGVFGAHFVQTFVPTSAQAAVFLSPLGNHVQIDELLFNTATSRVTGTLPDGSIYTLVNGGISTAQILVPEPSSVLLLAGSLVCLGLVMRRSASKPLERLHFGMS